MLTALTLLALIVFGAFIIARLKAAYEREITSYAIALGMRNRQLKDPQLAAKTLARQGARKRRAKVRATVDDMNARMGRKAVVWLC